MLRTLTRAIVLAVLMAAFVSGCSGKPAQTPEAFVLEFMSKHLAMIDEGIVDFYIADEAKAIMQRVSTIVAEKKGLGTLESLKSAKLDLSHLAVKVLEKKEHSYNDQAYTFLKINVTGKYTLSYGEVSNEFDENETFIIKAEGKHWKVTETENPWS